MLLLLTTNDSKLSSEHSKAEGHTTLGKQPVRHWSYKAVHGRGHWYRLECPHTVGSNICLE